MIVSALIDPGDVVPGDLIIDGYSGRVNRVLYTTDDDTRDVTTIGYADDTFDGRPREMSGCGLGRVEVVRAVQPVDPDRRIDELLPIGLWIGETP